MRDEVWATLTAMAAAQHGLVSADQCREAGCSPRALEHAVARNRLVRYRRRVYLVAGTPPSAYQPMLAACLATGPGSVASHLSAAWLWDFDRVRADHLEVTTLLAGARRLAGVRTHTTAMMVGTDIDVAHGVPVTSPARTAIDVAAYLSPMLLARFVDHVRRRGHAHIDDIARHLDMLGGRGRAGTRRLRAIVAERLEGLDPGDNQREVEVVRRLMELGVPRPEQGHQAVCGRRVFVLDAAWPAAKVALEHDGFDPHGTDRTTFDADKERDLLLREAGWEVNHISTRTDLRLVARYLRRRLSDAENPTPGRGELPSGRRGGLSGPGRGR